MPYRPGVSYEMLEHFGAEDPDYGGAKNSLVLADDGFIYEDH